MVVKKGVSLRLENLGQFNPLTENQAEAQRFWNKNENLLLNGSAGTGKTYMAIHFALEEILDKETDYKFLKIVRSVVPTRDSGFLPGTKEEKEDPYNKPYSGIFHELFNDKDAYKKMTDSGLVEFESTSHIRGVTWNNCIIVVDEMQNLNFHELDSVITRIGKNCRIIFCGDYYQSDFRYQDEKDGIIKFINIIEQLKGFSTVTFTWSDIIRSGVVRDYIMTKEVLKRNGKI